MIYISKGIVRADSTEHVLYICRGQQITQLTGMEAKLWLDGRYGFSIVKMPAHVKAIEHLFRMGLVEKSEEDSLLSRYRILTQCVLCAADVPKHNFTLGKVEGSTLKWLMKAGIRLSMAELVYLHEHFIEPIGNLLYIENRQALIETIYTNDTIFDNVLECQMEHAICRDKITAAVLNLLKHKKILVL